jgi:hypothetical protein
MLNCKLNPIGNSRVVRKSGCFQEGYFLSGGLSYKGIYKNNLKEGSYIEYKIDGYMNKEISGNYKDGKRISD